MKQSLRNSLIAGTAALFAAASALPAAAEPLKLPSLGGGKNDPYACGNHENLVGQNIADIDVADLREEQSVRIIKPGSPVTNDFHANRLNIQLDFFGTVVKVGCY